MKLLRARLETRAKPSRGGDAKPRNRTSTTRVSRAAWSTRSGNAGQGARGTATARSQQPPPKGRQIPMLSSIKQRMDRDEDEGFTLIELMVVLLIIAILLAIAIPTFLGARNTANARSTQENLRNALTAEQTNYTSTQSFTTDASSLEPSLTWVSSAAGLTTAGAREVNATLVSTTGVVIQGLAKDGNCYAIYQSNGSSSTSNFTAYTAYKATACADQSTVVPTSPPSAAMNGTPVTTVTGSTWYTSW